MPEAQGFVEVPVYDRYRLAPGHTFEGPAIVEERESTMVVGPRGLARVDDWLNLVVDLS
jgi:N-methylhydantoinase A